MFRDKITIKVNNQTIYSTTVMLKHYLGMINPKDKFTVKGIVTVEFENGEYTLFERVLLWLLLRKEQKC